MKVLFTGLSGSMLYGTNTPDSDIDYKTIFLPELQELLRGVAIKNIATSTGDNSSKNGAGDEDQEFIPVQVFMRDFISGQAYAIEMAFNALQNPDSCDSDFYNMCKELTRKYLTSDVRSMIAYAIGQAQKYGVKGTRLNALQSVKQLLELSTDDNEKLMNCKEVIDGLHKLSVNNSHVEFAYYNGPRTKCPSHHVDPAFIVLGKVFGLEISLIDAKNRIASMIKRYGARSKQAAAGDGHEWKAISHAVRIIGEAIEILSEHKLEFPLRHSELYTEIKLGVHKWDKVSLIIESGMKTIDELQETTTLPRHTPELVEQFYTWYDQWLQKFYKLSL